MESPFEAIVWIIVVAFGITFVVTILGLMGWVRIEKSFLKVLFGKLILEIVISGVYASKVTVLTPGGLPYAVTSRLRLIVRLKGEQSTLTVWQASAEGIVGALSHEAVH
jgi:hypothetical protein